MRVACAEAELGLTPTEVKALRENGCTVESLRGQSTEERRAYTVTHANGTPPPHSGHSSPAEAADMPLEPDVDSVYEEERVLCQITLCDGSSRLESLSYDEADEWRHHGNVSEVQEMPPRHDFLVRCADGRQDARLKMTDAAADAMRQDTGIVGVCGPEKRVVVVRWEDGEATSVANVALDAVEVHASLRYPAVQSPSCFVIRLECAQPLLHVLTAAQSPQTDSLLCILTAALVAAD